MLGLTVLKHKHVLRKALSDCFLPVKDDLGNVPVEMHKSKMITASILGVCRGYGENRIRHESDFNLIVDAVFEEIFRRESVEVQTLTETWLKNGDDAFMHFYYKAKHNAQSSADLSWLKNNVILAFNPERTIVFPL